ncbi:PREDICTED: protein maelstrom homolog, partial [Buceros rhinoceros silvestris]|uniref:protein maelstrom homolog n=1 Tax=Buceros rhinoceros silvestris TaxID=175836 RepID=UPI0005294864
LLTKEEKMPYAEKAREWNEKKKSQKMVKETCNTSGPVPACPARKIASITSLPDASAISWKNDEAVVADIFYFLNIYSHGKLPSHCEQRFLPCEIGCVKYSLQDGIMADFHHFIDPELPPCGFRYHCQTASDATHKIPVFGFHLSRTCYAVVLRELLEFVQPVRGVRPHFYCRSNDRFRISWCLNRMASVTGIEGCLDLLAVEDLVIEMYRKKHQKEPSKSWVSEELDVFKWDFCSNTRCKWHEENDIVWCALASCKKIAYCISKSLASAYGVSVTAAHLPLQDSDYGENNIVKTVILDAGRFQNTYIILNIYFFIQKAAAEGSGSTFPSWDQEFASSNCWLGLQTVFKLIGDSPRGVKTSLYEISTMRGRGITRWLESASDLSMSFSN